MQGLLGHKRIGIMGRIKKELNGIIIIILLFQITAFGHPGINFALRQPSQFNEAVRGAIGSGATQRSSGRSQYIRERLTSDRFSIIDADRNHAAANILEILAKGQLPSVMPYQIQLDLTSFCPIWDKISKTGEGPKDCKNCSFPEKSKLHVNIEVLLNLLQYFEKNGGRSVFVTGGGEPGAYRNWQDLFDFLANSALGLTLNTNGLFVAQLEKEYKNGRADILRNVFSKSKDPSVISISMHNEAAYKAAKRLNDLRNELGLNIIIRTTFLVHADTKPEEIFEFIERSEESGADMAVFKPEHILEEGKRVFNTNQEAFEIIQGLVIEQENIDKGYPQLGHQYKIIIQAMRPNRLSESFARPREMMQRLIENGNDPLCLGPLCNFYVNSQFLWGMCCDTKDIGMGSTPAEVFGTGVPQNPEDYYIEAMWGIIKLNPRHCITGCGFMEPNFRFPSEFKLDSLVKELKALRAEYRNGKIGEREIKAKLRTLFTGAKTLTQSMNAKRDPAKSDL